MIPTWEVLVTAEVEAWLLTLSEDTYDQVAAAIDLLEEFGPMLGRPMVDRISGSRIHHLKELRPGSSGRSELRVLFAFDPQRRAVLLAGGDKAGSWRRWYVTNIAVAEARYDAWLEGGTDG